METLSWLFNYANVSSTRRVQFSDDVQVIVVDRWISKTKEEDKTKCYNTRSRSSTRKLRSTKQRNSKRKLRSHLSNKTHSFSYVHLSHHKGLAKNFILGHQVKDDLSCLPGNTSFGLRDTEIIGWTIADPVTSVNLQKPPSVLSRQQSVE